MSNQLRRIETADHRHFRVRAPTNSLIELLCVVQRYGPEDSAFGRRRLAR